MPTNKIILNASEHFLNLGYSGTLMLRNYARANHFHFCSMIGGTESIRDIQEARNLCSEAFEFHFIESDFSLKKIIKAFENVTKPWVSRENLSENIKLAITAALLTLEDSEVLMEINCSGFVEGTPKEYDVIRDAIKNAEGFYPEVEKQDGE